MAASSWANQRPMKRAAVCTGTYGLKMIRARKIIGWPLDSTLAETVGHTVAHEQWSCWIDNLAKEITALFGGVFQHGAVGARWGWAAASGAKMSRVATARAMAPHELTDEPAIGAAEKTERSGFIGASSVECVRRGSSMVGIRDELRRLEAFVKLILSSVRIWSSFLGAVADRRELRWQLERERSESLRGAW
jgi:hypothetical protein